MNNDGFLHVLQKEELDSYIPKYGEIVMDIYSKIVKIGTGFHNFNNLSSNAAINGERIRLIVMKDKNREFYCAYIAYETNIHVSVINCGYGFGKTIEEAIENYFDRLTHYVEDLQELLATDLIQNKNVAMKIIQ